MNSSVIPIDQSLESRATALTQKHQQLNVELSKAEFDQGAGFNLKQKQRRLSALRQGSQLAREAAAHEFQRWRREIVQKLLGVGRVPAEAKEESKTRQARRLSLYRSFGGDYVMRDGLLSPLKERTGAFKKLVQHEIANESGHTSEKTVRSDLKAAAAAELEERREGARLSWGRS